MLVVESKICDQKVVSRTICLDDDFPADDAAVELQSSLRHVKGWLIQLESELSLSSAAVRRDWVVPLRRLSWLLICTRPQLEFVAKALDDKRPRELASIASALLRSIPPTDVNSAWTAAYGSHLSWRQRYQLVAASAADLGEDSTRESSCAMEVRWWTARSVLKAAEDWQRAEPFVKGVVEAVRASAEVYFKLLLHERKVRALDSFLRRCGTDLELEAHRVAPLCDRRRSRSSSGYGLAEARAGFAPILEQSGLRMEYLVWLLRRGAFREPWVIASVSDGQAHESPAVPLILGVGLVCTAWRAAIVGTSLPVLACVQAVLAVLTINRLYAMGRYRFEIIRPRLLFGTLLGWMTLLLCAITADAADLIKSPLGGAMALLPSLLFPFLSLSLLSSLIRHEILAFQVERNVAAERARKNAAIGLAWSAFWGSCFVIPARMLLDHGGFNWSFQVSFIVSLFFIGVGLAPMISTVLQLVWAKEPLTEPLVDPR